MDTGISDVQFSGSRSERNAYRFTNTSMNQSTLDVAMIDGQSCGPMDLDQVLPLGHALSRPRLRHLHESEWIVVSKGLSPIGFAAYKRADGEVRVVHELLVHSAIPLTDATVVTETLLSALEMVALEDGIRCLTFLLSNTVVIRPFERRGYMSLVLDNGGVWLQRKLEWSGWCRSTRRQ